MDPLASIPRSQPFVVWGLRSTRNTFRYIHLSFFRTLRRHGLNVSWVDDRASSSSHVPHNSICFVMGAASKHIPVRSDLTYVSHNISSELTSKFNTLGRRHLAIQVWTRNSRGRLIEGSEVISFDAESQTLFQPWGTPWERHEWAASPVVRRLPFDFWIGSVWNNVQNQGNTEVIRQWRDVLSNRGVVFRPLPRGWPDSRGLYYRPIRASAFGSSIVGGWQRDNEYLPCRVFKNLSAGVPPSGNNPGYKKVFGEYSLVGENLEDLAAQVGALSPSDREEMVQGAQRTMVNFTYKASLERIVHFLRVLS